jgi:cephalosporin-C deacetylase-like acetyl esterase
MRLPAVLLLLVLALPAAAQDKLNVLPAHIDSPAPRKMLYAYLLAQAQKHFDARREEIAALKTPADVHKRQDRLRAKFLEALGDFPEKTPLNAKVIGDEKRDGYRVERVIYESRPHHHVTATLYLPNGKGPFPAVLMPMGHSANGKADGSAQRACILLAQHGIAALPYDPIGQGERRQLLDEQGRPAIGSSTSEHTMVGVGALLVGRSTATYRIWDGIRSLDYLASRPEIDANRLGCTGCSGGGTLTSYLMALDDRIVAAAPSCYITSLERLFATLGPQDAEQNITGQVAFGMEHADYLNLRAPRPTLLCVASQDFFDNQGTWTTFREASRVYGILGHSERVALAEYNTKHGYPKPQREAVVRWMKRWLQEKDDAAVEGDIAIVKDRDLQCTRSGQVLEDFQGKSVFHLNAEREKELAGQRDKLWATQSRDEMLKEVRGLIGVPTKVKACLVAGEGDVARDGYTIRKLVFETEPGIRVPALDFVPQAGGDGTVTVYVHGQGKAADAAPGGPIEKLVKAGKRVLAVDLRGFGETAPGVAGKGPSFFGTDFKEAFLALHLNRPLLGQRTFDLLVVIETMAAAKNPIHLVGVGAAGPVALHAAALDTRIKSVTLERSVLSWANVVRTPVSYNQLTNVVPGALKMYDLPDLAALVAPRGLTIRGSVDARDQVVKLAAVVNVYERAQATYRAQKAEAALDLGMDR